MNDRWTLFFALLAAGCACQQTDPATAPVASSTATASAPQPAPSPTPAPTASSPEVPKPSGGSFYGTWKSASCGARKYERKIYFETDGTFQAEDLVSPCPPGTVCVWSGIVVTHGTYTASGSTITLTPKEGSAQAKPPAAALPTTLTLDAQGNVTESADGVSCTYQR